MGKFRWAVLLLSLGALAGVALAMLKPVTGQTPVVEWLETPRPIDDFRLNTAIGPFSTQQLRGSWHLVLFGYSQCPDICPTSLAQLRGLVEAAPDLPLTVVFVSVDPVHDSLRQLADYVAYFHDDFVGVSGDSQNLNALADSLGIRFKLAAAGSSDSIAHSITLSLIGPDGNLRGRMRPGFDVRAAALELSHKVVASG